jgi:hypothetical protein
MAFTKVFIEVGGTGYSLWVTAAGCSIGPRASISLHLDRVSINWYVVRRRRAEANTAHRIELEKASIWVARRCGLNLSSCYINIGSNTEGR